MANYEDVAKSLEQRIVDYNISASTSTQINQYNRNQKSIF